VDTWTLVIGGVIGLALALLGVRMLVTGRAPASAARSFRTVHDAGLYHLLFGLGLILLVVGTRLPGPRTGAVTAVLAVLLAAVAVLRYRPRGKKQETRGKKEVREK
jgi:hypothetical protein